MVAAGGRGDTLADVKAALRALSGHTAIAATYEVRHTNRARGKFFDQDLDTTASAMVHADDQGVAVTIGREMLDRTRAHASNVGNVSASRVAALVDYAPSLLDRLEKAVVIREEPGKLFLRVPPDNSGAKNVDIKRKGDEVTLSVGADHVPVAAERRANMSFGMLFLKAEGSTVERETFVRHGDRLVCTRWQRETSSSGMGQESHGTELETLTLR
jgi:hypothetical protein